MERKKRSKGSVWEFCYAKKKFGTFEEEMRAWGQKWVTFCTHTHAAKLVVRIWALHKILTIKVVLICDNLVGSVICGSRLCGSGRIFSTQSRK